MLMPLQSLHLSLEYISHGVIQLILEWWGRITTFVSILIIILIVVQLPLLLRNLIASTSILLRLLRLNRLSLLRLLLESRVALFLFFLIISFGISS